MSDEQTLSMEPVTNSENVDTVTELSTEEQDSLLIGEDMERQQDSLLAGKYKDAQELETAYKELEKKLGEKSETVSEETESKNEPVNEESEPSDNILEQLWQQGSNNKITKDTFEELSKMDPIEVAKKAMELRSKSESPQGREFTEQDVQQIHQLVGGQENYNNMISWAEQNVPEQEVNLFNAVMDQGNTLAAYFAVQSMALKYQDGVGKEGQMIKGKAPRSDGDTFKSQAELVEAQSDPRYATDEAYQEAILQKLERSNINF